MAPQDPDYFMKSLRLQGWFVDNLERRVAACRERVAGIYDAVAAEHAERAESVPAMYAAPGYSEFGGGGGGGGGEPWDGGLRPAWSELPPSSSAGTGAAWPEGAAAELDDFFD